MTDALGQALLAGFGERIGIPAVVFDDGYCCLAFDDVVLNVEHRVRDGVFVVYAELHEFAGHLSPRTHQAIAGLGYGVAMSGLGALAFDTTTGRLFFVDRHRLAGSGADAFFGFMSDVVQRTESLREIVASPRFGSADMPPQDFSFETMIRI